MKSFFRALAILAILASVLRAEILRVAAYNVENWNLADRMVDGVFRERYPKPEKEKAAVVAVVVAAHPDILALEEMGSREFLDELQARLRAAGAEYPYAALVQAQDPERHVALLSKIPFGDFRYGTLPLKYFGEKRRVLRGLLEARFDSSGRHWRLFAVHLKSRMTERDDDPDSAKLRLAEANAVREQIIRLTDETTPFLIVGDFNDGPRSATLKRFVQKGARTLTRMTSLADSRDEVWTHGWAKEGVYSRIDYILASPPMLPALVECSAKIFDGAGSLEGSDHRLVMVELDTSKLDFAAPELAK